MIPAILTVRYSSSRLPGKALLAIGGMSVLEFVVRRCNSAGLEPFIFTSQDRSDDFIELWSHQSKTKVYRGSLLNKVDRWLGGFNHFNLDCAHLVDVDDPFFDPVSVKSSLEQLQKTGESILLPSLRSDNGEASVGTSVTREALAQASFAASELGFNNLDVVPWAELLQTGLLSRFTESGGDLEPRFRLTLDYQEDYELISTLASKFGPETSRETIEHYLLANPRLVKSNYFRNKDFVANKEIFRTEHLKVNR